jgi:hypothetical protein
MAESYLHEVRAFWHLQPVVCCLEYNKLNNTIFATTSGLRGPRTNDADLLVGRIHFALLKVFQDDLGKPSSMGTSAKQLQALRAKEKKAPPKFKRDSLLGLKAAVYEAMDCEDAAAESAAGILEGVCTDCRFGVDSILNMPAIAIIGVKQDGVVKYIAWSNQWGGAAACKRDQTAATAFQNALANEELERAQARKHGSGRADHQIFLVSMDNLMACGPLAHLLTNVHAKLTSEWLPTHKLLEKTKIMVGSPQSTPGT